MADSRLTSLVGYYGVAFCISWSIWSKETLNGYNAQLTKSKYSVNAAIENIGALGPVLSAFIMNKYLYGSFNVIETYKKCYNYKIMDKSLMIKSTLIPFTLSAIAGFIYKRRLPSTKILKLVASLLIISPIVLSNEEIGWTGFAQKHLFQLSDDKFKPLPHFIGGCLWALWHFPMLFFRPPMLIRNYDNNASKYKSSIITGIISYCLSLGAQRMYMSKYIYRSESMLPCLLCHTFANMGIGMFFMREEQEEDKTDDALETSPIPGVVVESFDNANWVHFMVYTLACAVTSI